MGAPPWRLPDLLGQVVLAAGLLDLGELGLEPVDVLLLVGEDRLEQLLAALVLELDADTDALVLGLDGVDLGGQVVRVHLRHGGADVDRVQVAHDRAAVEEQDALDQPLGVFHLDDRAFLDRVRQAAVVPVLAHLGVDHVLVDGRELFGQSGVELVDHLRGTLHLTPPCESEADATPTQRQGNRRGAGSAAGTQRDAAHRVRPEGLGEVVAGDQFRRLGIDLGQHVGVDIQGEGHRGVSQPT